LTKLSCACQHGALVAAMGALLVTGTYPFEGSMSCNILAATIMDVRLEACHCYCNSMKPSAPSSSSLFPTPRTTLPASLDAVHLQDPSQANNLVATIMNVRQKAWHCYQHVTARSHLHRSYHGFVPPPPPHAVCNA
jgi:hypothetical protein